MQAIEKMIKVECSGSLRSPRIASYCQHCEQNLVLPAEPTEDSAETSFPSLGSCLFSLSRLKTASPNIVRRWRLPKTRTRDNLDPDCWNFWRERKKNPRQLLSQKWICEHNHRLLCQVKHRSTFLSVYACVCVRPLQASWAGRVCSEQYEAEGATPPVSVPGPDILGEPGRPAGHRQAHRRDREASQSPAHLRQRLRDPGGGHERVKTITRLNSELFFRRYKRRIQTSSDAILL